KPWPKQLPATPALVEFYSLCDGGTFSAVEIFPLQTVKDQRANLLRALDLEAIAAQPGTVVVFGFNHAKLYFVDTENDLVSAYNTATKEWEHYNQSFEQFLDDLFTPGSRYSDDMSEYWTNVLEQLEQTP